MILVRDLTFCYENLQEPVIENFYFELEKGDICGLIGESGSGKSTILRIICGLEKPKKGFIQIGENIVFDEFTNISPEKREVGMVFQDYGLFPHLTVEKNIKFGLFKYKKLEKEKILEEMLELVNLKKFRDRYPYQLSGGQQQRVALARSLAPRPKILLLDEPFSNLDSNLKQSIRSELKCILKEINATCILSSHDKKDIDAVCNKRLYIEKGKENSI